MKIALSLRTILLFCLLALQLNLQANDTLRSDLMEKADSLIQASSFDDAISIWEQLIIENAGKEETLEYLQSKLHYTKGLRSSNEASYLAAAKSFSKAAELGAKLNAVDDISYLKALYTSYYHSLAYSGDWQAALQVCEDGLNRIDLALKGKARADYIYDLAYLNDRLGNYAIAIEHYQSSIEELNKLEEKHYFDVGLAYNNLSTNYKLMGFFSARLNSLEEAKKYWEMDAEQIDYDYLLTVYANLLKVYIEYGNLQAAGEMLFKVDSTLSVKTPTVSQLVSQHRQHIIYYTANNELVKGLARMDSFFEYYNSLSKAEQKINHTHILASIQNLVYYLSLEDRWEASEELLQIGLGISREYESLYYQMALYSEYSKIADLKGESPEAVIQFLNQALAINKKTNIGQENLLTLNLRKAHYFQIAGKLDSTKQYIVQAFNYLDYFNDSSVANLDKTHFEKQHSIYIINALLDAGRMYQGIYETTNNVTDIKRSFQLYELSADVFNIYYQKESYNASLNHINKNIQEGIFTTLSLLGEPISIALLDLIEKNNSQVLRKEFEAKQKQFTQVPAELLNKRNLLLAQLTSLNVVLTQFPDSTLIFNKKREVDSKIRIITDEIESLDPQFDKLYAAELTIADIQEMLEDQELIVKYFQGYNNSFALLISRSSIELKELGDRSKIDTAVIRYHQKIQQLASDYVPASIVCYKLTMGPFEEQLKQYDQLVIIPDGKLNYLPFESLKATEDSDFLVYTHEISYSPSLSLWYLTNHISLARANDNKKLIAAFAPSYSDTYYSKVRAASTHHRLNDIKGAATEAQSIIENYGGDLYLKESATKWRFIEQSNNYQIYHLAMHTIYDDEEQKDSELVFHNEEKLGFNELYALHFPAELVVLSACNTGVGQLKAGEGMQSLSQALSYAGVRSSVYSLWPVPDKETAQIMQMFYQNLKSGSAKHAALADAKRTFINNNTLYAHPYFWAGFVLQGKQSPIKTHSYGRYYWIGFFLLVVLIFTIRKLKTN